MSNTNSLTNKVKTLRNNIAKKEKRNKKFIYLETKTECSNQTN